MSGHKASVKVRLLVDVTLGSVWGSDATMAQVHAQGTREAIEAVQRRLCAEDAGGKFRVVESTACDVVVHYEGKP